MDEDEPEEERFDGYDMPGGAQGGNTEAVEVDNLPEAETLLEEMIWVIPVLLRPIVMDPMPHPPIRETSLAAASATGVEKRRTSPIQDMRP